MGCSSSKEADVAAPAPHAGSKEFHADAPAAAPAGLPLNSKIIFVLGGPGSGKGTQCEKILARYKGVVHLSAGDLLRNAVKNGNTELEATMREGKLVSMEVTIGLLRDAMVASGGSVFLIDGFPRALDQAAAFEEQVRKCDLVLAFDCPEDEMRKRLLKRGETSGRADDNEATIVKRFHTFVTQSKPVIEKYTAEGKCATISATNTPAAVFEKVAKAIDTALPTLQRAPEAAPMVSTAAPAEDEPVKAEDVPVEAEAQAEVQAPAGALPADSKIIFVLGGPGSGKGTQCEKILAEYKGVVHLSAGDLLRDAVKNGNTELEAIMREGKLVPMDVTIALLRAAMVASGGSTFLIDGFPRALDQAEAFEAGIQKCEAVLFFDCSEDAMRARLLKRGETSGRADDNEATIVKRFHTFVTQSKPVVDAFAAEDKVHEINAMRTPAEVFVDVKTALDFRLRGVPMPAPAPEEQTPSEAAEAPAEEAAAEEAAAEAAEATPAPDETPAEEAAPEAAAAEEGSLPAGAKIIFVLGGPGSGKGTQCDKILATYEGVVHLSAGDLLRDAVKNGNTELEAIMRDGALVPMDVTIDLLRAAMVSSGGSVFLIDGFPRALDQAGAFVERIQECEAVLYFDCSEDAMRARLLKRGETSGRADDNEATIVKRFHTFVTQSKPVVDEYKTKGKVFEISSEQAPDDVFAEVRAALDPILMVATLLEA